MLTEQILEQIAITGVDPTAEKKKVKINMDEEDEDKTNKNKDEKKNCST